MKDFEQQRRHMIDGQIMPNGVTCPRIIDIMGRLPREDFVDQKKRLCAYYDEEIMLECGRFLLAPMLLAKLVQALDIGPDDRCMDIGAASGYSTAVLASLGKHVTALVEPPSIIPWAQKNIDAAGFADTAAVLNDPLYDGYAPNAPYDAILINGSVEILPDVLLDQLAEGGRLAAVYRDKSTGTSTATLWRRVSGHLSLYPQFDAWCGSLTAFDTPQEFCLLT